MCKENRWEILVYKAQETVAGQPLTIKGPGHCILEPHWNKNEKEADVIQKICHTKSS